jgi:hypothetical protein
LLAVFVGVAPDRSGYRAQEKAIDAWQLSNPPASSSSSITGKLMSSSPTYGLNSPHTRKAAGCRPGARFSQVGSLDGASFSQERHRAAFARIGFVQ